MAVRSAYCLQVHNSPHGMMQQLLAASQEAAARKPQVLLAVLGTEVRGSGKIVPPNPTPGNARGK